MRAVGNPRWRHGVRDHHVFGGGRAKVGNRDQIDRVFAHSQRVNRFILVHDKIGDRRADRGQGEIGVVAGVGFGCGGRDGHVVAQGGRPGDKVRADHNGNSLLCAVGNGAKVAHDAVVARPRRRSCRWRSGASAGRRAGRDEGDVGGQRVGDGHGIGRGKAVRLVLCRDDVGQVLAGNGRVRAGLFADGDIGARLNAVRRAARVVAKVGICRRVGQHICRVGARTRVAAGAHGYGDDRAGGPGHADRQAGHGAGQQTAGAARSCRAARDAAGRIQRDAFADIARPRRADRGVDKVGQVVGHRHVQGGGRAGIGNLDRKGLHVACRKAGQRGGLHHRDIGGIARYAAGDGIDDVIIRGVVVGQVAVRRFHMQRVGNGAR